MPTKNKILHFDTIDGIGNYDEVFSMRQNGSGQNVTGSHTFNSKMTIASQIENIKSISLKTIEFPFTAFNVRSSNSSNIIYYFVMYNGNNIDGQVVLRDKNYTNISTLLADINAGFVASIASFTQLNGLIIQFYLNPLDNSKITIKSNPSQAVGGLIFGNLWFKPSLLMTMIIGQSRQPHANIDLVLGISGDTYLQPDNYFNMNITNIQTAPCNANGKPSTFKLPLTGSFGEVIYWSENDGTQQVVTIDRPNTTLDYVNIFITDRWGFPVYSNGAHISFTLNVEYQDLMN